MKKIVAYIVTLLIAFMPVNPVFAQSNPDASETTQTIKGTVVDIKGNPIPGAAIESVFGSESTTTDIDGNFIIELPQSYNSLIISYPGFAKKKLDISSNRNPVVKLTNSIRKRAFINLLFANVWQVKQVASVLDPIQQVGVMAGGYGNWGGYGKIMIGVGGSGVADYWDRSSANVPTVTAGAVKNLNNWLNYFFGAGVAFNYGLCKDCYREFDFAHRSIAVTGCAETGLMVNLSRFNLLLGLTYVAPTDHYWNKGNLSVFAGLGVNF